MINSNFENRLDDWARSTGLTTSDLCDKLKVSRTEWYTTRRKGKIGGRLMNAILKHFPETDINYLLKGTREALPAGQTVLADPPADYVKPEKKTDKARTMAIYLQNDLLRAQIRTANALERLATVMEQHYASKK